MAVEQAVNQATNTAKSALSRAWGVVKFVSQSTMPLVALSIFLGGGSSVLPGATIEKVSKMAVEGLTESVQGIGGLLSGFSSPAPSA